LFEQKAPLREHLQQEHEFSAQNDDHHTAEMVTEEVQKTYQSTVEGRIF